MGSRRRGRRRLGTATLAGAILLAGFLGGGGNAAADAAFLCGTAPSVDPVAGIDPGPDNTPGTLDDPQGHLVFEYTTDAPGTVGGFTDGQRWTFLPFNTWTVGIDGGPLLTASKEVKFVETTLAGAISAAATTISIPAVDFPKFPTTFPFHLAIHAPPANVEIVEVTGSPAANQFTVTRGFAVTTPAAYGGGELIRMAGGGASGPNWSNDARFDLDVRGFLYSNAAYDGTMTQWPAGGPALPNIYPWNAHPLYPPLFQPKGYKTGFGFMSEWSYIEDLLLAAEAALPPVDAMNPVYRPFTPATPYSGGGTDYGHPWPVIPIESAGFSMPYNDVALKLSFNQLFGVTPSGPTDPASAHPMPQAWFRYRIEIPVVRDSGASDTLDVNLGDDTFEVGAPVTRAVTLSDASTTTWATYWPDEARTTFYFKMRENELYTNPFPPNTAGSPNGLLAAGGETLVKDALGVAQLQPWPALRLRAQLNDTKISLGYRTTTGTVGFPGDVEVALRHQCDTDDASEWLAAGHDQAIAGGTPDEMRLRVVSESPDLATIDRSTIDFTMEAVPDLVTAKLRSYDDGVNPNQAVDVSGDGLNDTFANDQIHFRRSATAVPRLHGVFLRHTDNLLNVPIDVMSLTADAAALPEHLRLDTTGEVVLVGPGDAERTMHTLDARTCGDVWGGGGCSPAPSGTLGFRYVTSPDEMPAVDTGALEQPTYLEQYEAMPANPAPSLAATAPQHFPLPGATDDFVQMTDDVVGATSVASGSVNDVFHVNFARNPLTGVVDVVANAVGGQPLVFRYLKDEDHGPWPLAPGLQNRSQEVWAVLREFPASLELTLDLENNPRQILWNNSVQTDVAVALHLYTSPVASPPANGSRIRAAGWIDREAGYTGSGTGPLGLAPSGTLTLDLPGSGQHEIHAVTSQMMRFDVGMTHATLLPAPFVGDTPSRTTDLRARISVPQDVAVTWTPAVGGGLQKAAVTTSAGPVPDAEGIVTSTDPGAGATGYGALTAAFLTMPAAPPDLVATQPGHFDPSPVTPAVDQQHLQFRQNVDTQTDVAAFHLFDLDGAAYEKLTDGAVKVVADVTGGRKTGLYTLRSDSLGSLSNAWAMLAGLPTHLQVVLDTRDIPEDADPIRVDWGLAQRSGAALAVVQLDLNTYDAIRMSGWLGTATGTADGLPASGFVTYTRAEAQNLPIPAQPTRTIDALWQVSDPMQARVGVATSDNWLAGLFGAPQWADRGIMTTLVPEHVDVHYRSGPDPDQTTKGRLERLVVDTCYRKPIIADDPDDDGAELLAGVDPKLVLVGLAVLGRDLGAILTGGDVAANLARLGAASQAIQDYLRAQAAAEAAAEKARRDAAAKETAVAAAAEARRAWKAALDLRVLLLKEGFAQLVQALSPRANLGNIGYGGAPDEEPPDEEEPDTVDDQDRLLDGPGETRMRAPEELMRSDDTTGELTPVDPNPPRVDPGPAPAYGVGADDPEEFDALQAAGIVVCTPIRDTTVIFKHNKDLLLASPLVSDMSVPESASPVQFPAMNAYPTDHVQFGSSRLLGQEEDTTAAVKVKLVEIETAAFDASNFLNGSGAPVFDRKKMCFTGRFTPWKTAQGAATGDLPVHVFFDKGRTTPTFWYDGSLELPSVPLGGERFPLLFRLKFIRPHSGQLGDLVGDEALLAPVNPLLETVREGCPVALRTNPESEVFLGGPIDGAKLEGWIKGILRTGTDVSVAKAIQYELTPIVVPPGDGIDAAIFAAKYNSGNRYFGLDAGLRVPLPHWLWVDQPYLGVCGGGKQDVHTCMTQVPYNAEPRIDVVLGWNSDGPGFGHLHVLFMNDDPSAASEADLNVNRMTYDWDIPRSFHVDGWFKQRPRDGFVDVKLHLTQAQSLSDVVLAYWDPKKPARWGDASESSDPENAVANYQLVMRDVPADFTATATIYAPKYANRDPDNISVPGHSMRDPDTLRGLVVHADLDLNQSSWLRIRLDSRKSRYDTGWKKGWGEDPAKNVIRASYEQEFKTDTSWVQVVYPGLHLSAAQQTAIFRAWSDDYVNGGLPVGGLTTFLDMDLGVRVTLKQVSSVGLHLDATHLTQSVKSSEFSTGGTAIVDLGEPLHVGGTWTWNEGAWYDDRYTNFTILGFPTTETGTGRDDVVLVNRAGNFWSSWKWMRCGNQLDMSDLGIIGWVQPVTTSGAVSYFHYNIGPMFSCTKWSNIFTGGLVNKFNKLVNAMNDASTVSATSGGWPLPDVLPRDTASPGNWGAWWYHTGGADYDNKITWNGPYPTSGGFLWMADGTYLRIATRHSQCGQIEVFLFGYYSNGQLRSVNRVGRIDKNFGATLCRNTRWKIEVSPFVSSVSNRVQVGIRAQYDRKNIWGNWKNDWKWEAALARTFTFDASGNGGQAPLTGTINPTPYSAVPGTTVSFNSGTSSYNLPCWFYPGDGSKPTKKSGANPPFTHQYLFPSQHAWNPSGNHTAMHVCYGGTSPSSNNVAQGTYGFANAP